MKVIVANDEECCIRINDEFYWGSSFADAFQLVMRAYAFTGLPALREPEG